MRLDLGQQPLVLKREDGSHPAFVETLAVRAARGQKLQYNERSLMELGESEPFFVIGANRKNIRQ